MATIRDIRQKYPQYNDLSNRELLDGIHNKHYSDIPKDEFYSKALGGTELPELETDSQIANRTVKGALRSAASTVPFVGGFIDNAEAGVRSLVGDESYQEELDKIRQENKNYQGQLDRAGVGGIATGAEIVGSLATGIGGIGALGKAIGGSKALQPLSRASQTAKGQIGLGAGIGAVEGAGFADEDAGTGALIGGAIGGSVPVVGRSVAKALGKTNKISGKSIEDIASNNKDIKTTLKGIQSSEEIAEQVAPLADKALQGTEGRVQNTILKELYVNSIDDIAAPARAEYSNFINEVGDSIIPNEEAQKLFSRRRVNKIAQDLIADNPEKYTGVSPNSISFLQDVKSRAAAQGRTGSENAPAFQDASKAIKETIDKNFSGFKELNTKFAKAIEAEDLVNRISNLNIQEDSNIAKSILKGQNKRDLAKSFGKVKANALESSLRDESNRTQALKRLKTRAVNELQGVKSIQGSLSSIPDNSIVGLGREGLRRGGNFVTGNQAKRNAQRLLQGGSTAKVSPQLNAILAQQLSRQTGE